MIKSLKKTAKANLGDLTSQIIDLELKGEEYTPQCQLLWDQSSLFNVVYQTETTKTYSIKRVARCGYP